MLLSRAGMGEAFDVLVRRHQRTVLRVAHKYLGHPERAEDATQNSFVELFRYLPRYQPQGKFGSFLYRIVINQCKMVSRAGRSLKRAHAGQLGVSEEPVHLPEEELLRQERRKMVERALAGLSGKLRQVLVLRFAAELSYDEIAEVLRVPRGTVQSRIFAGLERLRQTLSGELSS